MTGNIVGGNFALEFCSFDVALPGYVSFAPSFQTPNMVIIFTDSNNVKQEWEAAGVSGEYPVRISDSDQLPKEGTRVYKVLFDECTSTIRECDFTVPLDRDYTGVKIDDPSTSKKATVWGCTWQKTSMLPHDASSDEIATAINDVLGPDKVLEVTFSKDKAFAFDVTFASGVVDVFSRLDIGELAGTSLEHAATEVSYGLASTSSTILLTKIGADM